MQRGRAPTTGGCRLGLSQIRETVDRMQTLWRWDSAFYHVNLLPYTIFSSLVKKSSLPIGEGYQEIRALAWGFSSLLMGHKWLSLTEVRGTCHVLQGPSQAPADSLLGPSTRLHMIHSVARNCKTPPVPPRGGTWAFPPKCLLTHWNLCFRGFPHLWQIRTANITSTKEDWNYNNQVSLLDLWWCYLSSLLSTFILSFSFFKFLMYFLMWYLQSEISIFPQVIMKAYTVDSNNQIGYIFPLCPLQPNCGKVNPTYTYIYSYMYVCM